MGISINGRLASEDSPTAKLTNAQAKAARELRHDYNMSVREIATMYGTAHSTMSLLLRGVTYADAGGPITAGRKPRYRQQAALAVVPGCSREITVPGAVLRVGVDENGDTTVLLSAKPSVSVGYVGGTLFIHPAKDW